MTDTTYSGKGQVQSPVGSGALDPAVSEFNQGGVRIWPMLTSGLQMIYLQKNVDTANNYYVENKKDFDFWQSTYQNLMAGVPGTSALEESKARGFYTFGNFTPQYGALDYISSVGRGQSKASLRLDAEWFRSRRKISKYNVGLAHRVDYKYAMSKFNSELDGWNLGFRYEDHRKMMYDEQRHAHQAEILNLGIGAGLAVRQGLATAVQTLSEARSMVASQFGAFTNGLSSFYGFKDARQGIQTPQQQSQSATLSTYAAGSGGTYNPTDSVFPKQFDYTDPNRRGLQPSY